MAGDHLELKVKFTDPPGQDVRCHYDVTASNPGDEGPVVDLTFAHQVGVDSCATAANSMMVIDDLKLTLGNTPVPAKIAMVKQPQLSKLVAKPLTGQVFDLPEEPTGYGATARFCEEDDNCPFFSLPSTGWKGLGNPPGDKGYKFKDSICKAIVKPKLVKILCKPSDPSFVLPVTDDVGVELLIGESRYCASSVGGTIVGNPSSVFKVKNAPAPGVCPDLGSPSGAFIEVPRSALF
jgi:hypothetical protein